MDGKLKLTKNLWSMGAGAGIHGACAGMHEFGKTKNIGIRVQGKSTNI